MKQRKGFVSNSSSSSFIAVYVDFGDKDTFVEYLKQQGVDTTDIDVGEYVEDKLGLEIITEHPYESIYGIGIDVGSELSTDEMLHGCCSDKDLATLKVISEQSKNKITSHCEFEFE